MSETLFDADEYGDATPPRKKAEGHDPAVPQPWREPWKLLGDKRGVIGHHVQVGITAQGSILAACGVVGHMVGDGRSARMIPCDVCAEKRGL